MVHSDANSAGLTAGEDKWREGGQEWVIEETSTSDNRPPTLWSCHLGNTSTSSILLLLRFMKLDVIQALPHIN